MLAGAVFPFLGEGDGKESLVGGLFFATGRLPNLLGDALLEVGADLVFDVLLEAADDQAFVPEVIGRVVFGIADGGGV
ncbi:MAG: hypothetical protein JW395_2616 [Nitrospira sp.]|nr:hypothetical protein [Nitrospira sp.]